MKIDKTTFETHAVLTLKGEFDTFYCPKLQEEIESLIASGIHRVALNLRLVKFINSTALGAIIKAHKRLKAEGGDLVLTKASPFCRDIITKLGIDRVVPMFEDEEAAEQHLLATLPGEEPGEIDDTSVIFSVDDGRQKLLKGRRHGIATVSNVDATQIQFIWDAKRHGHGKPQVDELFQKGSTIRTKFQLKLFKKGFFELRSAVTEVADRRDGTFKVTATFQDLSDGDRLALSQFESDMAYLKTQIKDATTKA
jgi:anti-anti-sigma factor